MARRRRLNQKQKELISIAWKQVEGFVADWQSSPHEWENEIDIQVELASRIKSAYRSNGWHRIWGKYEKYVAPRFIEKKVYCPRVSCEPPIYYRNGNKIEVYKPDIVVWDDNENPLEPCEPERGKNDRMLWVCEIKFMPAWRKPYLPTKEDNRDLEKLRNILCQSDGAEAGCWLNIAYRVDAVTKKKFNGKSCRQGRLKKYLVTLPVERGR